jgi:hypothetical protein
MNISTNNQEVTININGVNYSWSMFVNGFKYRFLDDKIQEITTIKKENKKINNMFPAYYKSIRSNLVVLATGSTSGIVVIGNNHYKLGFMSSTWVDFNGDSDWIKINQDEFNKIKAEQNTSDPTNSKYNSLQLHCYEQSQEINELHGRIKLLESYIETLEECGNSLFNGLTRDEAMKRWEKAKEAKP